MNESINLSTFPKDSAQALAMFYLNSLDLTGKSSKISYISIMMPTTKLKPNRIKSTRKRTTVQQTNGLSLINGNPFCR